MTILERLHGGLIVSVQARAGSALDDPAVLAAMAAAAEENGAVGLRIQGVRNIEAVKARTRVPIIGLIKRQYAGFEAYITPTDVEVREILAAGADIVAFDATGRPRPGGIALRGLLDPIEEAGALAMADCATFEDGRIAADAGAQLLATTLCGYTPETRQERLPALPLTRALRTLDAFVVCEGGVHVPGDAAAARAAGAHAVVVGTAITNVEWLTERFSAALRSF
jgi:N-acylglucosamine-6-phosphate 2-epimerase